MNLHKLSQKAAAELLGTTPRSLRDWEQAGQGIPRNADGTYSAPALVSWWVNRQAGGTDELDPERERARKDKEAADKLALDNAERRGDLVRVSVMVQEYGQVWADHKQKLLGLGARVASKFSGPDADRIRTRIDDAAYELLADLADYRPGARAEGDPAGAEEAAAGDEAAAPADGEPVGGRQPPPQQRKQRRARPVAD